MIAWVILHITHGVNMHHQRNKCHHAHHHGGQVINQKARTSNFKSPICPHVYTEPLNTLPARTSLKTMNEPMNAINTPRIVTIADGKRPSCFKNTCQNRADQWRKRNDEVQRFHCFLAYCLIYLILYTSETSFCLTHPISIATGSNPH